MKGTGCKSCLRDKPKADIIKANVYKPKKNKECMGCFMNSAKPAPKGGCKKGKKGKERTL